MITASTFGGVHDFFSSGTWLVIRNLLFFFAAVFWLATVWWIYKDARRRVEDPWLVAVGVMLGILVPFLGVFIYMLFRPPEYLDDERPGRRRGDESDELVEEGLLAVLRVVLLAEVALHLQQLSRAYGEAAPLDPREDLAGQPSLHGVGFDQDQ